MKTITITMQVSDHHEHEDFMQTINGPKYKRAIDEFDAKLRSMYKYEDKDFIALDEARKLLAEIVESNLD